MSDDNHRAPSAFDALREFTTAPHIRDSEACGIIARDLRAAVAEHDALRGAVRAYLALHWTATAEMGAHDQTEASVDAAVAAEMAALDALRAMVQP